MAEGDVQTRTFTKELLSLGLWTDSQGNLVDLREGDLEKIIGGSPQDVPVKLGHTSDEFTALVATRMNLPTEFITGDEDGRGQVRLGCAGNFRVEGDRLLGDIEIPESLAALVDQEMITNVSAEMQVASPYVITAVALLGAEMPAASNLREFSSRAGVVILLSKQAKEKTKMATSRNKLKDMARALLGLLQDEEDEEEGDGEGEGTGNGQGDGEDEEEMEGRKKKGGSKMSAEMQAEVTQTNERLAALERENRELRRESRETHYAKVAEDLPHIQDKDAFGKEMAALEMSAPKNEDGSCPQVDTILQAHKTAAEAQKQSDLFSKVSLSSRPNTGQDDTEPSAQEIELAKQAGVSEEKLRQGKRILAGKPAENGSKAE